MTARCAWCAYYAGAYGPTLEESRGNCVRRAPIRLSNGAAAAWPEVDAAAVCGEFVRHTTRTARDKVIRADPFAILAAPEPASE